jgi:flagellin-like protein
MQLKKLFDGEERAVSPVIGVILMVAITVILAAVIGTFVLGLGNQVQQTSPQAQFGFDYTESNADGNAQLEITHEGGDGINENRLSLANDGTYDGDSSYTDDAEWFVSTDGATVQAGDTAVLEETENPSPDLSQSVSVVWNAEDGDRSSTLAEWEP